MNEHHYERGIKLAAKALSRTHVALHRFTRGRVGRHWDGGDVAFITTTGRRTGRPHTTPLACIHHRDGVAVVASNGGSCRSPDWWLNLQRQPVAEIELAGTKRTVFARMADAAEQKPLADSFGRAYPRFERYRRRSRRFIPVVVLASTVPDSVRDCAGVEWATPVGGRVGYGRSDVGVTAL
jgi:deazaflavin-dependent oxidoreductase (nitroreductase family)